MKVTLLIIIGLYRLLSSEGRLIPRNLKLTTEITTKTTPPLRIARDISEEDTLMGFSNEDTGQRDEFIQAHNKRTKYFFKYRSANEYRNNNMVRIPRRSNENTTSTKNATFNYSNGNNQKLVKKPIPKYSDIEYDYDFQEKVNKSPKKVADSDEHEDEDFNLADYDFDVNHDEFAGRGKPLEPRNKVKEANGLDLQPQSHSSVTINTIPSDVKSQNNFHLATFERTISNKKERAIAEEKKSNKIIKSLKEVDYDDATIKGVTKETKLHNSEEELNDENDESKEFERKVWSVRTVRSVWNISNVNLKEKSPAKSSKFLTILPMFPQVPYDEALN